LITPVLRTRMSYKATRICMLHVPVAETRSITITRSDRRGTPVPYPIGCP
jgi:hypothetical protein